MPSLLNRADLLACFEQAAEAEMANFAAVFGYRLDSKSEPSKTVNFSASGGAVSSAYADLTVSDQTPIQNRPTASYLRVISHQRLNDAETADEAPLWFRQAKPYTDNDPELQAPNTQPAATGADELEPAVAVPETGAGGQIGQPYPRYAPSRDAGGERRSVKKAAEIPTQNLGLPGAINHRLRSIPDAVLAGF